MGGRGEDMTKHGMRHTSLYSIWSHIIRRCTNPNAHQYKDYGGRGIRFCDKWRTFEGFYEDMGSTYEKGLTIDRIDNNGNYCKENCRWITHAEQQKNRRNNRFITFEGRTMIISDWAREVGVDTKLISARLLRGIQPPLLFKKIKPGGRLI